MTDNPYLPPVASETSSASRSYPAGKTVLYWNHVVIAFAITFGLGLVLASLWGLVGFALYFALGANAPDRFPHAIAAVFGWCIGWVALGGGLVYLCRSLDRSRVQNCLLLVTFNVIAALPFILWDLDSFDWSVPAYYLGEFLLAATVGASWNRMTS